MSSLLNIFCLEIFHLGEKILTIGLLIKSYQLVGMLDILKIYRYFLKKIFLRALAAISIGILKQTIKYGSSPFFQKKTLLRIEKGSK